MTSYCTPTEVRTQIERDGTTGSASDTALGVLISGVSDALDEYFNRPDGFLAIPVASARVFPGDGTATIYIDECVSVTIVAVKESPTDTTYTTWASTDWVAFSGSPNKPDFNRLPYTGLMTLPSGDYTYFTSGRFTSARGFTPIGVFTRSVPTVQVTARWGYALSIPPLIKEATIALSARMFKQGQGAWSDTIANAEFGGLIYKAENADIKMLLDSARYYRPPV